MKLSQTLLDILDKLRAKGEVFNVKTDRFIINLLSYMQKTMTNSSVNVGGGQI